MSESREKFHKNSVYTTSENNVVPTSGVLGYNVVPIVSQLFSGVWVKVNAALKYDAKVYCDSV